MSFIVPIRLFYQYDLQDDYNPLFFVINWTLTRPSANDLMFTAWNKAALSSKAPRGDFFSRVKTVMQLAVLHWDCSSSSGGGSSSSSGGGGGPCTSTPEDWKKAGESCSPAPLPTFSPVTICPNVSVHCHSPFGTSLSHTLPHLW